LPAGKEVEIFYQVAVDNPFPADVTTVSSHGTLSGGNFVTQVTNTVTTEILNNEIPEKTGLLWLPV